LLLSGRLDGQILSPPIEIGKRHDQQISVIGFTKCPVQRPGPEAAAAGEGAAVMASARPAAAASA
jgi:hypothetical protein